MTGCRCNELAELIAVDLHQCTQCKVASEASQWQLVRRKERLPPDYLMNIQTCLFWLGVYN